MSTSVALLPSIPTISASVFSSTPTISIATLTTNTSPTSRALSTLSTRRTPLITLPLYTPPPLPTSLTHPKATPSIGFSPGAKIGIAISVFVIWILFSILIYVYLRRRKREQEAGRAIAMTNLGYSEVPPTYGAIIRTN